MDEFDLIGRLFRPLAGEGAFGLDNDAAVMRPPAGREIVATADMMAADVHFLADDPAELVARKLLRVNLSDLAAMGAVPTGYLVCAGFGRDTEEAWIERFALGLAEDQLAYDVRLLGGDTIGTGTKLVLSLTAFGTVEAGRALVRSGARAGDAVFVTGTVGDGLLGLMAIRDEIPGLSPADRDTLGARYRLPEPRVTMGSRLVGLATACLDVSDGLVGDLGHVAQSSGVAIELEAARVPLSAATRRAVALDAGLLGAALTGGDDYELAFTAPEDAEAELADIAAATDVSIARIGRCVEGEPEVVVRDREGGRMDLARTGWRHPL